MSFLAQVRGSGAMTNGRRADQRFAIALRVELVWAGLTVEAVTRDLSIGGASLEVPAPLRFGARLALRMELPGCSEAVETSADVRWVQALPDGKCLCGVCFLGLRARDVWAVVRLQRSLTAKAG